MKVFITWSGAKSKAVALALREWLPDVVNSIETWMSEVDIGAGERWNASVGKELQESRCGIICLTRSNLEEPWILFEAGALAKTLDDTYVCPYLLDLEPSDIPQGPLAQFQAKRASRDETLQLLMTFNQALGTHSLPEDRLRRSFQRSWPHLEEKLRTAALKEDPPYSPRPVGEMVQEILEVVRSTAAKISVMAPSEQRERDGLVYFREPGGHGEWLSQQEVIDRLTPADDKRRPDALGADDDPEVGIPEDKRNPMWG